MEWSFNPCFAGSCFATAMDTLITISAAYRFNPCFAGSCFATKNISMIRCFIKKFQSLFCWKLFCNGELYEFRVEAIDSFNPCFAGSCFATRHNRGMSRNALRFQSLFCWKLFCNLIRDRSSLPISTVFGFNPCFAGSCFATCERCCLCLRGYLVSILVLLEAVLQLKKTWVENNQIKLFQSLFCWKLFCNLRVY